MRDIVFITCDSLRADRLGAAGYQRDVTPFLDRFAERSTVYTNAYAVGPGSFSMSGVFTSTVPLTAGAYYSIPASLPTLASALPDEYATVGVHSNGHFVAELGHARGFDEYVHAGDDDGEQSTRQSAREWLEEQLSRSPRAYRVARRVYQWHKVASKSLRDPRVPGKRINEIATATVERRESPVFLWVHYMDTHSPFIPEREHLDAVNPELSERDVARLVEYRNDNLRVDPEDPNLTRLRDVYDAEVRRTDALIRDLLDSLGPQLSTDPFVVVSADHGEGFGEHGYVGHSKEGLYEENLNVPLVVHDPERDGGRVEAGLCSAIDVAPTVVDAAGGTPPPAFQGTSLRSVSGTPDYDAVVGLCSNDDAATVRRDRLGVAYRTDDWHYVYREYADDELYDVDDPREEVSSDHPAVVERLSEQVLDLVEDMDYEGVTDLSVSESERERLRALGYL